MTVVSDMSPLHYLILINCEPILPLLYGQVFTPPAVIEEMRAPNTPEVVRRWIDSPPEWLRIVEPADSEDMNKNPERELVSLSLVGHKLSYNLFTRCSFLLLFQPPRSPGIRRTSCLPPLSFNAK